MRVESMPTQMSTNRVMNIVMDTSKIYSARIAEAFMAIYHFW